VNRQACSCLQPLPVALSHFKVAIFRQVDSIADRPEGSGCSIVWCGPPFFEEGCGNSSKARVAETLETSKMPNYGAAKLKKHIRRPCSQVEIRALGARQTIESQFGEKPGILGFLGPFGKSKK